MNNEKLEAGLASDLNRELEALLPLAAKAAGIEIEKCTCKSKKWPFRIIGKGHWNPLESDSDAFRLAVDLDMSIDFKGETVWIFSEFFHPLADVYPFIRHFADDKHENTRIAITQCAAEIGKRISV